MKATLFDFRSTDSWEFLRELPKRWPYMIHSINEFFFSWCAEETAKFCWILPALGDVPSVIPAPVTVGMASPSSCIGQYLLNRPSHTSSNKSSCRPATVLYLKQQPSSLHKAVIGMPCSLCSTEEASRSHDLFLLIACRTVIYDNTLP